MKPAKFIRVNNSLFEAENNSVRRTGKARNPVLVKQFQSNNQAKKESRYIQIGEDKFLGRGSVRVL